MARTIYFDCFAGIAGDMVLGALIDLGLEPAYLERELKKLPVEGYRLEAAKVSRRGVGATQFRVFLGGPEGERPADSEFHEVDAHAPGTPPAGHNDDHTHHHPHRSLSDILGLIEESGLSEAVRGTASAIFTRLGEAEAAVHGTTVEEVHFHEVGGVDAIVDVVGAAIGLEKLGVDAVYASPLHLGSGFVRCAHGLYPVPAPATANLVRDVPVYTGEVGGELVTPTGAAIITTVARGFGPMPPMVVEAVGYGAGTRDREFPNVLRGYLGQTADGPREPSPRQHEEPDAPGGYHEGRAVIIETNIDDMNPQLFEHLLERLLDAGAQDVVLIPVQMKKGRPGTLLQVMAHPSDVDDILAIIFTESTTIGARTYDVTKRMLRRETRRVDTPLGPVRVKVSRLGGRVVNAAPEYEDCRELARRHGLPLKQVCEMALKEVFRAEFE